MKVTRIIFVAVFSIICVFLVVSASSIYVSAENDLKQIKLDFEHIYIDKSMVKAEFHVSANDTSNLPTTLYIMHENLTINPYSSSSGNIFLNLNTSSLGSKGWAINSILIYTNAVISEFVNGIGLDSFSKNISTFLPSIFSTAQLNSTNGNNSYNLVLSDFISVALSVMSIGVYEGSKFLGNMTASSSSGSIGGNVTFSGILGGSGLSNSLSNISIQLFGMKIAL